MKLLFDQNLSFNLCRRLADLFPGSAQVRSLGLDTARDQDIWNYAKERGFTLVINDSDFAEFAALIGPPPKVIWLRGGNQPTDVVEQVLRTEAETIADFGENDDAACLEIY